MEKIQSIAQTAREQRLEGTHHSGYNSTFPLIGYCFDNSYVCINLLQNNGFDPKLIEGTTERVADELIVEGVNPQNLDSVDELGGLVHYWIEVVFQEITYVVDIASDSFESLGECLVTDSYPEDYIKLPDSESNGDELLSTIRSEEKRCEFCGDHKYTEYGCPKCQNLISEG